MKYPYNLIVPININVIISLSLILNLNLLIVNSNEVPKLKIIGVVNRNIYFFIISKSSFLEYSLNGSLVLTLDHILELS